jgi:uroporphyrinogen-III synthase
MPVIVTRPAREAHAWVHALQEAGLQALALPLIAVGPAADPRPVLDAWRRIAEFDAVMFVSGNAVEQFFALKPAVAPVFIAQAAIKTRAFVTGPGSRDALLQAGVEGACIDAPDPDAGQFDSEALWARVAHRVGPGYRVLIVRGANEGVAVALEGIGRDWFAGQVQAAGGQVEFVVSYQRQRPDLTAADHALVERAAADGSIWLFSSSESIANLTGTCPQVAWQAAKCVVTHARIAQAAHRAGFGVVCESRPVLSAVVASIESLP